MQDKNNFGKFIQEKRKELNLTQNDLANKLNVMPTTISKWERGVTYPDITVITDLCKELKISEHEFFCACDDEVSKKEKKEAKKYQTIRKTLIYGFEVSYLIAIITCLICNVAIDHKLSWSLIVIASIAVSFSLTNLPFYIKDNKFKATKVSAIFMILVYLLLITINFVNKDSYFFSSSLIASFEFIFWWLIVIVWSFLKIDKLKKTSLTLLILSFSVIYTNPVVSIILDIPASNNFSNQLTAIIMINIAIILFIISWILKKHKEEIM